MNKNDSKWNIRKETHTLLFSLSFDLMIIKISFTHFIGTMKGNVVNINLLKIPKIFIERLE